MQIPNDELKDRRISAWPKERVEKLSQLDAQQLRANAVRLGEADIVALCDQRLRALPGNVGALFQRPRNDVVARRLVSRAKAFEARGVYLEDTRTSWGGVRKSDGKVVMCLWTAGIKSRDGACNYLLWAPNVAGARPWSDLPSGQERLKHCRLLGQDATAEGLLVHGDPLEGYQPEHKARSVHGVDLESIVHFKVEKRGDEYWAVWGKKI